MICARAKEAIFFTVQAYALEWGSFWFACLTLPSGGVGYDVIAYGALYRKFVRAWKLFGMPADGLRLWERHQSGGWHLHLILPPSFSASETAKRAWVAVGGGRMSWDMVPAFDAPRVANYLSNELSKCNQKDFSDQKRQVRAWAAWGPLRTRSSEVFLDTPVGRLLSKWPVLTKSHRWKLLCLLSLLSKNGLLPPAGSGKMLQWKTICVHKSRLLIRGPLRVPVVSHVCKSEDGLEMKVSLMLTCEYRGEKIETWGSGNGKLSKTGCNRLVNVEVDQPDHPSICVRMRLPDGSTAENTAPLAKRGDLVRISISELGRFGEECQLQADGLTILKGSK